MFRVRRFDLAVLLTVVVALSLTAFLARRYRAVDIQPPALSPQDAAIVEPEPHRVLYLAPDAEEHDQLMVYTLGGSQPLTLTQTSLGVWDFTVSSDGGVVVFAALREDGNSDLWRVETAGGEPRILLDCDEAGCSGATWSPDGSRIIYERREALGPPRLWWLEPATGETVPVFDDNQALGFAPRFSPDGRWINYLEPLQGVRAYNLNDGRTLVIPSQMGEPGAWNPASDALVMTDIRLKGERYTVPLLHVDLASGKITDLSGAENDVEDGAPTWSPDGEWIAFTRTVPQVASGAQLWLMRSDGSDAHALTAAPEFHYSLPSWSPDGKLLLFHRFQIGNPDAQPGIGVLDIATGETNEIASPGRFPVWAY